MLLMGGLHGYAGRLASRRIGNEFERLAKYRLVQSAGVGARLWKPSLLPYARKRLELATVFDDSGLGAQGGKLYGLAREQGQELTLELEYDKSLEQYRAVHPDPAQFQPPMAYDPGARLWALSLDDSHRLSDVRLLERMVTLRGGRPAQLRRVLEISGATRAHLDEIWSGGLPPPSLVEALERFKVELGLAEVAATQKEDRLLSTDTQRVLFCLVPHLGHWPEDLCLRVHDADGELQQVYGRRQQLGLFKRSVSIRQLARGGFVEQTETLLDTSTALAHEAGVLDLILGLLPGDSQPSARDPVVRRAWCAGHGAFDRGVRGARDSFGPVESRCHYQRLGLRGAELPARVRQRPAQGRGDTALALSAPVVVPTGAFPAGQSAVVESGQGTAGVSTAALSPAL